MSNASRTVARTPRHTHTNQVTNDLQFVNRNDEADTVCPPPPSLLPLPPPPASQLGKKRNTAVASIITTKSKIFSFLEFAAIFFETKGENTP